MNESVIKIVLCTRALHRFLFSSFNSSFEYSAKALPSTPSGSLNDSYVVSSGDEQEPNSSTKSSKSKKNKNKKRKNHSTIIPQPMLKMMHSDRLYMDGRERPENDVSHLKRSNSTKIPELTLYDCLANEFGFFAFLSHAFKV